MKSWMAVWLFLGDKRGLRDVAEGVGWRFGLVFWMSGMEWHAVMALGIAMSGYEMRKYVIRLDYPLQVLHGACVALSWDETVLHITPSPSYPSSSSMVLLLHFT